jgi:hypothetical protein
VFCAGFKFVGIISPSTSFNPHLVRSPDGLFALYFRVNAVDPLPLCSGDAAAGGPGSSADSLIKVCKKGKEGKQDDDEKQQEQEQDDEQNCIHAGGSETGTNMYVATARKMTGPWTVEPVGVAGEGALHVSNPSVAFIASGTPAARLGKVAMAFRYNSPHGAKDALWSNSILNMTILPRQARGRHRGK